MHDVLLPGDGYPGGIPARECGGISRVVHDVMQHLAIDRPRQVERKEDRQVRLNEGGEFGQHVVERLAADTGHMALAHDAARRRELLSYTYNSKAKVVVTFGYKNVTVKVKIRAVPKKKYKGSGHGVVLVDPELEGLVRPAQLSIVVTDLTAANALAQRVCGSLRAIREELSAALSFFRPLIAAARARALRQRRNPRFGSCSHGTGP